MYDKKSSTSCSLLSEISQLLRRKLRPLAAVHVCRTNNICSASRSRRPALLPFCTHLFSMSPPHATTNSPDAGRKDTRVDRILDTAVSLAQQLTRAVGILTGTAALAGGTLWLVVWWPLPLRSGTLAGAGLTLIFLLAPAAVLGLFYAGLRDLAALPDRVSAGVSDTMDASIESYNAATDGSDSWWGWGRRLFQRLWALRSLLGEHRAVLLRYGALWRLVTPGFLLLVVGAAGITVFLVPGALLALALTLLL